MLKNVKLRDLFFKKVNLPITKRGMNRLLLLCCCVMLFTACKKVTDPAVINPDQAAIDDQIIADYIAGNNLTGVAKKVGDTIGVWYIVEKPGTVSTLYSSSSSVTVGYTGKVLTSGKVFAQTDAFHPSYVLGTLIRGWQLGIPKANKGGIVRLLIPSRYAYGPYAQPSLGLSSNAVLDFTIEVFDVTN